MTFTDEDLERIVSVSSDPTKLRIARELLEARQRIAALTAQGAGEAEPVAWMYEPYSADDGTACVSLVRQVVRPDMNWAEIPLFRHPAPSAWQPIAGVRAEVAAFALLMERELQNNDHKPGWKNDSPKALVSRVLEEAIELHDAVKFNTEQHFTKCWETIAEEAADVANMAMMVADVCGALPAPPAQTEEGE